MEESEILNPNEIFIEKKNNWYEISQQYWENHNPTISGMLDGFPEMSI